VVAIPLAAGVAYSWGILLSPAVGTLLLKSKELLLLIL